MQSDWLDIPVDTDGRESEPVPCDLDVAADPCTPIVVVKDYPFDEASPVGTPVLIPTLTGPIAVIDTGTGATQLPATGNSPDYQGAALSLLLVALVASLIIGAILLRMRNEARS